MFRLLPLAVVLFGCSNLVVIRGSSNDYLKKRATTVVVNAPPATVQPVVDELFFSRGFRPTSTLTGENQSQVIIYKGSRPVPPNAAPYGLQLGSWYAARLASNKQGATEVTLMGKPMVGQIELCSDYDNLLADVQYACTDTKVPPDWVGMNLVSARDETEVVDWVLAGIYERLMGQNVPKKK